MLRTTSEEASERKLTIKHMNTVKIDIEFHKVNNFMRLAREVLGEQLYCGSKKHRVHVALKYGNIIVERLTDPFRSVIIEVEPEYNYKLVELLLKWK